MAEILIVEDDIPSRQYMEVVLRHLGHSVSTAGDGEEALLKCDVRKPDLVLSDILMPNMDGYEFVRQLRLRFDLKETPVIFVTATYHQHEAKNLARKCGVNQIIAKPAEPEEIARVVNTAVGKRQTASPISEGEFRRDYSRIVSNKVISASQEVQAITDRLTALIELGKRLASAPDAESVFDKFCHGMRYILGVRLCLVIQFEEDGQKLARVYSSGAHATDLNLHELVESVREKFSAEQPFVRFPLPGNLPAASGNPGSGECLSAIMRGTDGSNYGAAFVAQKLDPTPEFTKDDEKLLGTLVAQAVIACQNARRQEQIQAHLKNLAASEKKYRSLVEHAPIGVYSSSVKEDRFLSVNPTLVNILGYDSEDELLTLKLSRDVYCNAEDRAQLLERSMKEHSYLSSEVRWKRKDGSACTIRLLGRIVGSQDGETHEVIAEDITDQKSLENQLRQAQKMEAVGRLAGGVAHDFNNLLGIIIGYGDLLVRDRQIGEQGMRRLSEIQKAAHRAVSVTRQLLAFSRKQLFETRTLDLNQLVENASSMLTRLVGEDVTVLTNLNAESGLVNVDPNQIEQVLMNLVVNARDAMPNGGELNIETANVELGDAYRKAHAPVPPGNYVLLTVGDNGCGMDSELQKQIFEPFFTTKEKDRGTGLGLSTVYGIVKQSNGFVSVYSEVGVGTVFKVYLPRVYGTAEDATPTPAAIEGGTETILLVEDDAALRELDRELLEELGYAVLDASNGSEALEVSEKNAGTIDLLMTDVIMPGINGKQLAELLLQSRPKTKVLYVSGYTDNIIRQVISSTAVEFLQKPLTRETLSKKLRAVLSTESRSDSKGPLQSAG